MLYLIETIVKSFSSARLFATPWTVDCTKLLRPWNFQGKSTGVGCHFLLQGIFPTQGSNPGLSHCRQTLYHLSHQGSRHELRLKQPWQNFQSFRTLPRMKDRSTFSLCLEAQCGSDKKESLESPSMGNSFPVSSKIENINLSAAEGGNGTEKGKMKMIDRWRQRFLDIDLDVDIDMKKKFQFNTRNFFLQLTGI